MPIVPAQGEPELVDLRLKAQGLAAERRERLTSAHLLVAMVDQGSAAGDLLSERRLTRDALLKAARSSTDDEPDPLRSAIQRAREVARGMRAPVPSALHLLVALLTVRRCAAYRALDQCGIDVHRLRAAATSAGLSQQARSEDGSESRRRAQSLAQPLVQRPARRAMGKAVTVPLMQLPVRPSQVEGPLKAPSPAQAPKGAVASAVAPEEKRTRPSSRKTGSKKSRFALDARRFRMLSAIGRNLSLEAERGELASVVGREEQVEQILDVLAKRDANNPCLVGVPGVGKTSIVWALARRIAIDLTLAVDDQHVLVQISISQLLAGTQARGALAQRITDLKRELKLAEGRVVLFFDDIHQVAGAESTEELIGELRRGVAKGELRCLGTTTPEEFQRVIEADPVFDRFFSRIDVDEPDLEHACEVLESVAPRFAEHHGVGFDGAALTYAVAWSARYISGRALPEKALSIVDLAAARASRRGVATVLPEQIAAVVSELASVPVERLLETDGERMLRLEKTLSERVVGHAQELSTIAGILRRNAAGLGGQRPIGTFLLLGPTGVGKTETAKAIAATLFGGEHAMARIDLSEYSEAHSVARLIGAPPGYVGHEAGGQLTEAVRRRPYQVLLLDEIEKAHQEVLETFLPLFDEGRLTDGRGRTVDFTNTVILLTSNIGAREAVGTPERRLGFGQREVLATATHDRVVAAARERLSPEFFNRIDEVLVYRPLAEAEVEEIARRLLQRLADVVYEQREIELSIEPSVVSLLLEQGGFDVAFGARPMKRAIARFVEAPLAQALLSGRLPSGRTVDVRSVAGTITFECVPMDVAAAE
jgi:ATP-dependent Clp protease ATP-binding subunit ClpC